MYASVAVGNHSITVRGTSQDGQTNEVIITLEISPESIAVTVSGTVITVIIESNLDATFECQLDDLNFVPCKYIVNRKIAR